MLGQLKRAVKVNYSATGRIFNLDLWLFYDSRTIGYVTYNVKYGCYGRVLFFIKYTHRTVGHAVKYIVN